MDTGYYASW